MVSQSLTRDEVALFQLNKKAHDLSVAIGASEEARRRPARVSGFHVNACPVLQETLHGSQAANGAGCRVVVVVVSVFVLCVHAGRVRVRGIGWAHRRGAA